MLGSISLLLLRQPCTLPSAGVLRSRTSDLVNWQSTANNLSCYSLQVKGDAFLARVFDDGEGFKRMDFRLPEVSSSAQWVKVRY